MKKTAEGKYEPSNAAEAAVLAYDANPHPGWRHCVGTHVDCNNALEAMGHRRNLENGFTYPEKKPWGLPEDVRLYAMCVAPFKRSLKGAAMCKSQYGLEYVEFSHHYTPDVVEALGTARAIDLMQKQIVGELQKLAATHPVIVWRLYPEIVTEHGYVKCYLRFHVMTEAHYQHFVQQSE